MKKIPLQSENTAAPPVELSPRFLLEALEVLLLGAVWLFVLVWTPFFQNSIEGVVPKAVQALQWMLVLGLATVLIALTFMQRKKASGLFLPLGMLMLMAGLSLFMMLLPVDHPVMEYSEWVSVLQSLLGLGYFVSIRVKIE